MEEAEQYIEQQLRTIDEQNTAIDANDNTNNVGRSLYDAANT